MHHDKILHCNIDSIYCNSAHHMDHTLQDRYISWWLEHILLLHSHHISPSFEDILPRLSSNLYLKKGCHFWRIFCNGGCLKDFNIEIKLQNLAWQLLMKLRNKIIRDIYNFSVAVAVWSLFQHNSILYHIRATAMPNSRGLLLF